MKSVLRKAIVLAIMTFGSGAVFSVSAQDGTGMQLEEIIVTAQRREESLQEIPISVTAISAEALASQGVTQTANISQAVPSVQFTTAGGSGLFYVRGVGNMNGGIGEEGANAFYVDNVYMPDLVQTLIQFNNIERMEVLKGPQGTLFGRNSMGGLVHVITREPGDTLTGDFKLGAARFDTVSGQAYVAGPLTDTLSADIAISASNRGRGWGRNLTTGDETAKFRALGVRSKVVWKPTDEAKLVFSADYGHVQDGSNVNWHIAPGTTAMHAFSGPPPWRPQPSSGDDFDTTANVPGVSDNKIRGASLTGEFNLDWATLTSITAVRELHANNAIDVDGGPLDVFSIYLHSCDTTSFQQELRLASNNSSPLSWQTGLFYFHSEIEVMPQYTRGNLVFIQNQTAVPPKPAVISTEDWVKQVSDSVAGFAEVTYEILPKTKLTAGLRYTQDKRGFNGYENGRSYPAEAVFYPDYVPLKSTSERDSKLTYRLSLSRQILDDINIYASFNRGFKSGLYSMNGAPWDYVRPETIDAYEIGAKSEWFDKRLRLNLAAFYYKIDDYQVKASADHQFLMNAAKADVTGFETEFEALLTENLSLFGAATFLDTEYDKFPNAVTITPGSPIGGFLPSVQDVSGNELEMSPDFSATVGVTYRQLVRDGELQLTVAYSYNDGYFFDSGNFAEQPSFRLLNASLGYQFDKNWGLELWGRNLTDEKYYRANMVSPVALLNVRDAPRTYGLDLSYHF